MTFTMNRILPCFQTCAVLVLWIVAMFWIPSGQAFSLVDRRETLLRVASSLWLPSSLVTDSAIVETMTTTTTTTTNPLDFSGVYRDPKHPEGFRVIRTGGPGMIIVTIRDNAQGPTLQLVGTSTYDSTTKKTQLQINVPTTKDGPMTLLPAVYSPDQLLFVNFCNANGGVGVASPVLSMGSIRFPDGNIWVKDNGLQGVYVDSRFPDGYRVIRELGNAKVSIDVANRVDQVSTNLAAVINKGESSLVIDFSPLSGPKRLPAEIRGDQLIFNDGTTWTKL